MVAVRFLALMTETLEPSKHTVDDDELAFIEVTAFPVKSRAPGSITIPQTAIEHIGGASPCASASSYRSYGRQSVHALLAAHEADVQTLRKNLEQHALFDPACHDNLWLLRFVMSHPSSKDKGAAAARATLEYRQKHSLDTDDYTTRPAVASILARFYRHVEAGGIAYYAPDPSRGVMIVGRPMKIDFHAIARELSVEDTAIWARVSAEWIHRYVDEVTRRTGYLTKYARVVDLRGMRLSRLSREFQRRQRESAKELEDYYPQMLEAVCLCHPPSWIQGVWRTMRGLMPPRFVEKVDMISPTTSRSERDRLLRFCTLDALPTFLGGTCAQFPLPNARKDSPPSCGLPSQ